MKNIILISVALFLSVSLSSNLGDQLGAHFKAVLDNNPEHIEDGDFWDFRQQYPNEVLDARTEALFNFCAFLEMNKKDNNTLHGLACEFENRYPASARHLLEDRLGYARSAAELAILELNSI